MLEPRIVYACKHNIVESFSELHTQSASYEEVRPPQKEDFPERDYNYMPDVAEAAYQKAYREWCELHFGSVSEFQEWEKSYIGRNVLFSPDDLKAMGKSGSIHVDAVSLQSIMPSSEYEKSIGAIVYPDVPHTYEEDIDFHIVTAFKTDGQYVFIDWLRDGSHPEPQQDPDYVEAIDWLDESEAPAGAESDAPMVPGQYFATMQYTRVLNATYEHAQDCPRCCGDGWYVGLFEIANTNPGIVQNENKLVQAFFKFIHTKKLSSGYGSVITTLPGKYDSGDVQDLYAEIEEELSAFESYYKNHISKLILQGHAVTPEEQLRAQSIVDMSLDEDSRAVSVSVRFFTMSNAKLDVSLVLPEEES